MADAKDNAGVIGPPPLIALAAVLFGLALDWLMPVDVLTTLLSFWTRAVIGAALALAGIALAVSARQRFIAAGTNVEPWKPAVRLATSGPYRYVRNPMYVGLMLMAGSIGVGFASDWTLVMLLPLALTLRNGVVLREERYMERKFGEEYLQFKDRVPRWGIW